VATDDATTESGGLGRHLKRYGVFYVIAVIIAVLAVFLPSRGGDDKAKDKGNSVAAGGGDGSSGSGSGAWKPASGNVKVGAGTTVGGVECKDGVKQLPDSQYSLPCVAKFTGDNGGETARGVTADTIKIVIRTFPQSANSQAVQKEVEAAGFASTEINNQIRDQFVEYLNTKYELYGRKVEFVTYESKFGDATQEALGGGREGACQDATLIADEMKAFGVTGGSGSFSECAAERGLVVFGAAAYFSESFYKDRSPYLYNTTMSCDRISTQIAEYIGKRMVGKPAKYAGDPELAKKTRTFGTYVPDNEEYQKCTDITQSTLKDKYKADPGLRVNYALDISRFVDQAKRAVIQFKAGGVTTIITASDPISIGLMTKEATAENYFPEWFIIGTAGQDTDNFGRSYDQKQVDGHMFGISELGSSAKLYGATADAPKLYAKLNPGKTIPGGTVGNLYDSVNIFNLLQAAGPTLTAANIEKGIAALPTMGAPDFAAGKWSYAKGVDGKPDHTAVDDVREVYWDGSAPPGPDERDKTKKGAFVEVDKGKRYDLDQWPTTDPNVFPGRG
jgi:hypothetical protein